MTDESDVIQVEMIDDGCEVIGERVEVVSGSGPIGTAMTPAVIEHAMQAGVSECRNLVIKLIGSQAPRVREHDRRTASPVRDKKAGTVSGFDEGHGPSSACLRCV